MTNFTESDFELAQLPSLAAALGMDTFEISAEGFSKQRYAEAACDEDAFITVLRADNGQFHFVSGE